jgi:uncharacterized protein (TIGR02596 family)
MTSSPTPRNRPNAAARGFTLIELLAVMAIIAVVIAFAVPTVNQTLKGSQLTQGGQVLTDQLGYARQLALSRNRTMEFRIYRFGDPETPGEVIDDPKKGRWRGFQIFEVMDNGAVVPASGTTFQRMPRMAVLESEKYSTLLSEDYRPTLRDGTADPTAPELPIEINGRSVGKNYQYTSFRFLPDGTTNLPARAVKKGSTATGVDDGDSWYVTVMNMNDLGKNLEEINYSTVQIDPFTGSIKTFRPTVGGKPKGL